MNQEAGFENLHKRIISTTLKVDSQSRSNRYLRQNQIRSSGSLSEDNEYEVLAAGCEAHWEVVERILFVYSKLNSGQSYVQGMNEIIGPIYYTFATDPNIEWRGKIKKKSLHRSVSFFRTCRRRYILLFYEFNDSYSR